MNVLYVSANPKPDDESVTRKMGDFFLKGLAETNPQAPITRIDLYQEIPPYYDYSSYRYYWYPLFIDYTPTKAEEQAVKYSEKQIDIFLQTDILVISCPMWNFSMPAILKAWLDCIMIPNKLFKWDENAEIIPLHKVKTAVLLCSSGGEFFNNAPNEHLVALLKSILHFIKIKDIKVIFADRQNPLLFLEQENVRSNSIQEARELGKSISQ